MSNSMQDNGIRVVHTMGNGRSGSTLINIVMDHRPDVIAVGELTFYTRTTLPNGEYCSCGVKTADCEFWSKVYTRWDEIYGGIDHVLYRDLQMRYERYRSIPRLIFQRITRDKQFARYGEQTVALYQAIKDISGCEIIADSSKNPVRVFALSMVPGIDLDALQVVRDVRGVVWSSKKPLRKNLEQGTGWDAGHHSEFRIVVQWWLLNTFSNILRRRLPNSLLVRYEDVITEPQETLKYIGNVLNVHYEHRSQQLQSGDAIEIIHLVAGNRLRMRKRIVLRKDITWRDHMPQKQQQRIWLFTHGLMRHLGYKR